MLNQNFFIIFIYLLFFINQKIFLFLIFFKIFYFFKIIFYFYCREKGRHTRESPGRAMWEMENLSHLTPIKKDFLRTTKIGGRNNLTNLFKINKNLSLKLI